MRILISGAGIAGQALAFWLSRPDLKHIITIVEQTPTLRTSGLQIDLRNPGIEVLKRMGLEDTFRQHMVPEQGVEIVDSSGRRRGYFPVNNTGKGVQAFTTEWEIMRGDFCRLLWEANRDRVEYIFGTTIANCVNSTQGVQVEFSKGSSAEYDLVVGADGVHSRTRRLMLNKNEADPVHILGGGQIIAYFTMPMLMQPNEAYNATVYLSTNKRGIMTRRSKPDKLQVYLGGNPDPELLRNVKRGDMEAEKQALATFMTDAGWRTPELIKGMLASEDFYCERVAIVTMKHWSRDRIVLLGDAAYCPSVNNGMGTTCAVVGAYILAGEISKIPIDDDKGGLQTALQAYEACFKPYMLKVQAGLLEDKGDSMPSGKFGVGVFNLLASVASLFRVNVAKWMMKEDIKGWELPRYAALEA